MIVVKLDISILAMSIFVLQHVYFYMIPLMTMLCRRETMQRKIIDLIHKRLLFQQRIRDAWMARTNVQETGHNHINHMSQEIVSACASLPVYSFDQP